MYIVHIQCKVLRWKYKKHSLIGLTSQKNIISFSKYCGNIVFLKKCTRIWSVLYYQVDGKWKMIFHKRIQDNMIFSAIILQRRSFQKICSGIWSFLYYQEIYLFFLKKYDLILKTENEKPSCWKKQKEYDIYYIFGKDGISFFYKYDTIFLKNLIFLLLQFYSQWNYRNVNKLNWMPLVILNNKLTGISSMCYGIIINQFKWFWKVQSYICANIKICSCILFQTKIVKL